MSGGSGRDEKAYRHSIARDGCAQRFLENTYGHSGTGETGADLRPRPYSERRAALLDVLAGMGPPIEPVPATVDPETARGWWQADRIEAAPATG